MKIKLGEICHKETSGYAQKDLVNLNGEYPIYGASGYIKCIDSYHQENPYVAVVKDGAGVGRTMYLPGKSSVIGTLQYLIPEENIDPHYLYYLIRAKHLEKYYMGAAIPHIYFKDYKNENIPDYDFKKQLKIVSRLSRIEKIIDYKKQQIEQLDNLIKARFVEAFGDPIKNDKVWPVCSVENLCVDIYGGGTPSKSHPEYYENGDIPWISSKDMKTEILYDSQIHINALGVENSTARIVPINSIIMVIRSGILKHTLPVAINAVPVTVNQDLKVFIPGNQIDPRFMAIQFKLIEKDILSGVRAVTADNIEFNSLKQRKLIVPDLELQKRFVLFVKQIDKSKVAIQKSLDETQLLFDSLLQKYFG